MTKPAGTQSGLPLGLAILALVAAGFCILFFLGPDPEVPDASAPLVEQAGVLDVLDDQPTRRALEALKAAAPATFTSLEENAQRALSDGADREDIARLTLQALFAQFKDQAYYLQFADSPGYQAIMAGLADGLRQLEATRSPWCKGPRIADYLAQNDDELVPVLLSEFPYGSQQYVWAMSWMETILTVSKQGQDRPRRYGRPTSRDEAVLQQQGLALGSEQWGLALQIAAFANSEGVSYAKMQEVIGGMDVCKLGIAVETVSARLPADVRARIWADLMPEIMVGNTPYALSRVTDYFFIDY